MHTRGPMPIATLALLLSQLACPVARGVDDAGLVMPTALQDLVRTHKVKLVYFVPADRKPTADHDHKIIALMTFVADVFQRDLRSKGYETYGLDFEFAGSKPLVHLVRGEQPAAFYSGAPRYERLRQWQTITSEVQAKLGKPSRAVYLVFAETYDTGPSRVLWPGAHAQGMYLSADSGIAVISSWMLRDELCATTVKGQLTNLFDATPVPRRAAMGIGKFNAPKYEFVEDAIGTVAHELGHALGLPHDSRHPLHLMGNGYRYLNRLYLKSTPVEHRPRFSDDNARLLSFSRFISEQYDATDRQAPKFSLSLVTRPKPGDRAVTYQIDATDDAELGAILYYDEATDSVVGGQTLSGKEVKLNVTLTQSPLRAGQQLHLHVKTIDRNGGTSWATVKHTVEGPVLSTSDTPARTPSAKP